MTPRSKTYHFNLGMHLGVSCVGSQNWLPVPAAGVGWRLLGYNRHVQILYRRLWDVQSFFGLAHRVQSCVGETNLRDLAGAEIRWFFGHPRAVNPTTHQGSSMGSVRASVEKTGVVLVNPETASVSRHSGDRCQFGPSHSLRRWPAPKLARRAIHVIGAHSYTFRRSHLVKQDAEKSSGLGAEVDDATRFPWTHGATPSFSDNSNPRPVG